MIVIIMAAEGQDIVMTMMITTTTTTITTIEAIPTGRGVTTVVIIIIPGSEDGIIIPIAFIATVVMSAAPAGLSPPHLAHRRPPPTIQALPPPTPSQIAMTKTTTPTIGEEQGYRKSQPRTAPNKKHYLLHSPPTMANPLPISFLQGGHLN